MEIILSNLSPIDVEYYSNSYVGGQNVTIKSSEDTIVRGGNVDANEKLKMDVGGNLLVESIQDTSKSESYTLGLSAGASKGKGSNSGSLGANFNISKGESNWVNQQTSLTGGSVDIYVENKTTLKGAVIASESGDLVLNTGSFEYSDIKDKDRSSSVGGGISVGGGESEKFNKEKNKLETTRDYRYSVSGDYSLRDKRQTNFATVGEGEIIVRDGNTDLSGLNRDVEIAQYETKAETGLEGSFRLDDVLVNRVGWVLNPKQAYEDIKGAGIESWEGLKEFGGDVAELYEKAGNYLEDGRFVTNEDRNFLDIIKKHEDKIEKGTADIPEKIEYYSAKWQLGILTKEESLFFEQAVIQFQQGLARNIANEAIAAWNVGNNTEKRELMVLLWKLDPAIAQETENYFEGQRNIARAEEAARRASIQAAEEAAEGVARQKALSSVIPNDGFDIKTLQVGLAGGFSFGYNISGSAGFAVSDNKNEAGNIYFYYTYGGGAETAIGAFVGVEVTASGNDSINNLKGGAVAYGVGYEKGPTFKIEDNKYLDGNSANSQTITIGAGTKFDGLFIKKPTTSGIITYTGIIKLEGQENPVHSY